MRKSILTKVVYYIVTSLIGSLAEQTDAGASFAAIIAYARRSSAGTLFIAAALSTQQAVENVNDR